MEFKEALEFVIEKTKHERFRELTDPDHKDYNPAYIDAVFRLVDHINGVTTTDVVDGMTPIKVEADHKLSKITTSEERMAICRVCSHYDDVNLLCKLCGCNLPRKTANPQERCPISKW